MWIQDSYWFRAAFTGSAVAVLGCSIIGGQTGDEDGEECRPASTQTLSFEETSPLGFSGSDVLDEISRVRHMDLRWVPPRQVGYGPERGTGELEFAVAAQAAEVRFVHLEPPQTSNDIGFLCEDRLEVDVPVQIKSQGGALDETLDATLHVEDLELATLYHELELDALNGTFALNAGDLEGLRVLDVSLSASLTPWNYDGQLLALFEERTPDAVTTFTQVLAEWPKGASCQGTSVPFDAKVVPAPNEVVATANAAGPVKLRLQGGTATATFAVAPASAWACMGQDDYDGPRKLNIPAALSMETAGGRFAHTYAVSIQATVGDASVPAVIKLREGCNPRDDRFVIIGDFEENCGDWGVDVSSYGGAELEFELALGLESGELSGSIHVIGESYPTCVTEPESVDSSQGCRGTERIRAASIDVSGPEKG